MLVEKKKIKFKPSATSIAKEQETEPSSIHSTGVPVENLGGEGRGGASTEHHQQQHQGSGQPGQAWASSVTVALGDSPAAGLPHYTHSCSTPKANSARPSVSNREHQESRTALPCCAAGGC